LEAVDSWFSEDPTQTTGLKKKNKARRNKVMRCSVFLWITRGRNKSKLAKPSFYFVTILIPLGAFSFGDNFK